MAKKTVKKTVRKKAATRRKATKPAVSKKTARAGRKKTAARKTASRKTASRKTAARAKATRQRRTAPAPRQRSRIAAAATVARGVIAGAATAVASKLPWSKSKPDALQMLEQEHRRFEALLAKGEETTEQARTGTPRAARDPHLVAERTRIDGGKSPLPCAPATCRGARHRSRGVRRTSHSRFDRQGAAGRRDQRRAMGGEVQGAQGKQHGEEEGHMFRLARGIFSREELRDMAARMEALRR